MGAKLQLMGTEDRAGKPQQVYAFHCPGCGYSHPFHVPHWSWNGSLEAPTFKPSLMVNAGGKTQCHLFVTDGKIQFLNDCHHKLAGQTVEIPDWNDDA